VESEDDIERWSEELAGRRPPGISDVEGTGALRGSIRAQDASARASGAQDRTGLERMLRRLESEGLLQAPADVPNAGRSHRLRPWLALAATVAALAVGVRLFLPQPGVEPGPSNLPAVEKPRGYAGVIRQSVADPQAEAAAATRELSALGLQPRPVPAQGRIILEVDVAEDRLEAYRGWAEPRGGRVGETGLYRIIFESMS